MNDAKTKPTTAQAAGSELEPDGGNMYRPHQLMLHSGQFWRCAHGYTGFRDRMDWVGCERCAQDDPVALRRFQSPNAEWIGSES